MVMLVKLKARYIL